MMKILKSKILLILPFIFTFFILSCSQKPTQYSKQSAFSYEGFSEEKSMEGVFHVKFTGVGPESIELVEQLLDRRSAEITIREGYDGFVYYTKSRNDSVGSGGYARRKNVPSMYGVIHLKKGVLGPDVLDARAILAKPIPNGVKE